MASAKYKSKKKLDSGNVVYEYGPRQVANRHKEKAEQLEHLDSKIGDLRKQYGKDLGSEDEKESDAALAVALMDHTYERVGNKSSADDGHYGVTEWRKKHVSFKGDKAVFEYVGKSGVKHTKEVTDKKLVSALKERAKGKGEDECLLCVSSSEVNEYLEPFGITAKDIRGYHANAEMHEALRRIRKKGPDLPKDRKEKDKILKEEFNEALEEVAEIVGHEPSTLGTQYAVPGLKEEYLHNGEVTDDFVKTAAQRHLRRLLGTDTPAEREDKEVKKTVEHAVPKKKPPRHDLRKHRVDAGKIETPNGGDKDLRPTAEDPDLRRIQASKRIAHAFLRKKAEDQFQRFLDEKYDGGKKQVPNPNPKTKDEHPEVSVSTAMEDKNFARKVREEFSQWLDDSGEEDLEEKPSKREEEALGPSTPASKDPRGGSLPTPKGLEDIGGKVGSFYAEAKAALTSPAEVQEVSESFGRTLEALTKKVPPLTPEEAKEIAALDKSRVEGMTPAEVGEALAKAELVAKVVANPLLLGGTRVSGAKKDTEQLVGRAVEAFEHFSQLGPDLREAAAQKVSEELKSLDKDSPKAKELDHILSGLALSSIVEDGKTVPGRSEPSGAFRELTKQMAQDGTVQDLLLPVRDMMSPEGQRGIRKALDSLSDEHLVQVIIGEEKDSPYAPLGDFLSNSGVRSEYRSIIRDALIRNGMDDMTFADRLVLDRSTAAGAPLGAGDRASLIKETTKKISKDLESYVKCLSSGQSPEECESMLSEARRQKFDSLLQDLPLDPVPGSPAEALSRRFVETGDARLFDAEVEPSPDTFHRERLASYAGGMGKGKNSQGMSKKITPKSAKIVTRDLDRIASLLEEDHAMLGIPKAAALDLAKRLDLTSEHVEKVAGLRRQAAGLDPAKNTTETKLAPGNFDPSTVASEAYGQVMQRDADENYMDLMNDNVGNQVRAKQQLGQFSNAKVSKMAALLETRIQSDLAKLEKLASLMAKKAEEEEVEEEVEETEEDGEEEAKKEASALIQRSRELQAAAKKAASAKKSHGYNLSVK